MVIKNLLNKYDFRFNRSLGQNFITDTNLLEAIVSDSGITADDSVVEIGAGAGTLTRALAAKAARVTAFEIDQSLRPVLSEALAGLENTEVFFENVLKMSDEEIILRTGKGFCVVANLPYYITTPLIMRFVESPVFEAKSLTFTVQKEVAERLCAEKNTPEYGAVTLGVALRGKAEIMRIIDKRMFYPVPKVDSAVVKITLCDRYGQMQNTKLIKLLRCAFQMRRKTLSNNISAVFSLKKEECDAVLAAAGVDKMVRGEALGMEDFINISKFLPEKARGV